VPSKPGAVLTTGVPKVNAADSTRESKSKADLFVSAEDFVGEIEHDLPAAEKKYRGKLIEVSGVVRGFRWLGPKETSEFGPIAEAPDVPARSILQLKSGDHLFGLQCITVDKEPWATVSRGEKVKVQGKWHAPGSSEYPALADCMVVDAGTFTTPVFTAAALVREYSADMDAFVMKYDNKYLIVAGEVEKRAVLAFAPTMVGLKTDSAIACICNSDKWNKSVGDVFTAPLPGQQVKYLGYCSKRRMSGKAISIDSCLPITQPLPKDAKP
jgi:hypothetical protein